jgi:hypothetical protein
MSDMDRDARRSGYAPCSQWQNNLSFPPSKSMDVSDPAVLSGIEEEGAWLPLTTNLALPTQLDEASMCLTMAVLAVPGRPRTLSPNTYPAIHWPSLPLQLAGGAAASTPAAAAEAVLPPLPPSSSLPPRRRHRTSNPFFLTATAIGPAAKHGTMRQASNESRASPHALHPAWTSPAL